jgi:2-polyprenyl-6-methoxyphenol hydroxylase-like FAD-dependent oxidoreductase
MDVIVAGAGPTGLALAYELGLAGVEAVVIERLAERIEQVKGGAIQARTSELLDLRGLLDPIAARSLPRTATGGHFAMLPVALDASGWGTRHPFPLSVPQWIIEEELERASTVPVRRDAAITAVEQNDDGVTVTAGGTQLRASYLVACDGAHSTVRKLLDVPFPGRPGTFRAVLTDIVLTSVSDLVPTEIGHMSTLTRRAGDYWGMLVPVGGGRYRFTVGHASGETSGDDVATALTVLYGEETVLGEILTLSYFTDATRQVERYRHGRVLFAGDAAHIHPPYGGQGLNLGVRDAFNLGWKLAATVHGWAPPELLDTYHSERHPDAARVLHHTSAQRALADPSASDDIGALRDIVTDLLRVPGANYHMAGMMSGLDAEGRAPDHDLVTDKGPTRVAELMRSGRGLLLDFGSHEWPAGWTDRVDIVHAKSDEDLDAVLIRPDGTLAWNGDGPVTDALRAWFGAAVTSPGA